MTDEQIEKADIERFKICTRAIFPDCKNFPHKEDPAPFLYASRMYIGVWTGNDDVIMVTASYRPSWKTGNPRDEYWVTGFNNVSRKVTSGFGITTTAIVTGQRITYTEKEFMSYLKRVKTLLETKVWDGKVIC
jgi:hypothetical protein